MQNLTFNQEDYSAGLNDTASDRQIARNQASKLINWDITHQGRLDCRKGLQKVVGALEATTGTKIIGLGVFDQKNYLMAATPGKLWRFNGTNWACIADNLTEENDIWFENCAADKNLYFIGANQNYSYWDGSSETLNTCITTVTPNIKAKKIKWFQNHMLFLNSVNYSSTTYPLRLLFSNFGDPKTITVASDFLDAPGRGQIITCEELGEALVIFKEKSIMFMSGYGIDSWQITASTSNVSNIDEAVGCTAIRGVTRVGSELWFMDESGQIRNIYQTDFDPYRRDIVSQNIQGTLSQMNKSQIARCVLWTHDNKVFVAIPTSANYNNLVLVNDLIAAKNINKTEAWTTYSGSKWLPSHFASYDFGNGAELVFGTSQHAIIYRHVGDTDDGDNINCRWDSKLDDYDRPERYKRHQFGYLFGPSTTGSVLIDLYVSMDGKPFAFVDSINLAGSGSRLGPTGQFRLGPTGNNQLGGHEEKDKRFRYDSSSGAIKSKTIKHSIRYSGTDRPTIYTYSSHFKLRPLV